MPKAKKFIDRKSSVTFNLVHRSQRDPLVADESAPQRVLVPIDAGASNRKHKEQEPELTVEQRREQQQKYGVFFDDDYNYLQHLKDTREVTMLLAPKAVHKRKEKSEKAQEEGASERLNLPSSVFASELEEDVGMLNKAAPQGLRLDLDPDVVAALDEDFDFDNPENELEDNFMELAMAERSDVEEESSSGEEDASDGSVEAFGSDEEYEDDSDDLQRGGSGSGGGGGGGGGKMPPRDQFAKEETESRFSQYSMSSSVMRRNEGLTLLDNRFEKMFASYDDTEVGPLDCEEIAGALPDTHAQLLRAAEEMAHQQHRYQLDKEREVARISRLQEITEEESDGDEPPLVRMQVEEKERWDCESILSTYSNIYNRPSLIQEPRRPKKIKINPKTGIPLDTIGNDTKKLTARSLARHDEELGTAGSGDEDGRTHAESVLSTLSVLSIRPKDETAEDKRDRKRLLKEYRRERRAERKANREAFREEKKRQEKIMMNNRNNVQGNRIL